MPYISSKLLAISKPNHRYYVKKNGELVASRCNTRYIPKRAGEVLPGIPLNIDQVKQLLEDTATSTLKDLSTRYGISYYHIRQLIKQKNT